MNQQTSTSTALAERRREAALAEPLATSSIVELTSVTRLEDLDRFQMKVMLHPVHQYAIPTRAKVDGQWKTSYSVGITSDGYDYLNRVMGVQLVQPEQVADKAGNIVPNPIHRPDYDFLRLMGIWRNDLGQLVTYREDIEVDYKKIYADARLNAVWYDKGENGKKHTADEAFELLTDQNGMPMFDDDGNPVYRLDLPASAELKALQTLSQLRRYGIRYAFTVAKTRILKAASGIRRLPIAEPRAVTVSVAGWRDLLQPDERIRQAQLTSKAVWGSAIDRDEALSLTDGELEAVGEDVVDATDHIDQADEQGGPSDEEKAEILAREAEEATQS
jgi:hypothetical protein